ncbi:NAD-dependent histone deacetylase sir2 [Ciborinia camelliae]|nr:NAD-dependent histone deacetylase sir2 [Ciborinia camelliae]
MSSATLNGVGSVPKSPVSKIINLVSDDEDSENDDVTLHEISGMSHHQSALPQDVDAALSENKNSSGDEQEEEEEDDDDDDDGDDDSDDDDSLLEDFIEGLTDETIFDNQSYPEKCTREEGKKYRSDLRRLGPREFCRVTVESGAITAKKLLTAFAVRPPSQLDGQPDQVYYQLLSYALRRELMKRLKLPQYNSVADAVNLIKHAKKIIVLTGAGISTSLGIPDFRSPNGLYARLEGEGIVDDPQDVFNIEVFKDDPTIFFGVARDMLPSTVEYSPTHQFIWLLQNKGKLLTNYTQNIDNIESNAGILAENLIQCHGSFATATCQDCEHKIKGKEIYKDIINGQVPRCEKCILSPPQTKTLKRKRSWESGYRKRQRSSDDDIPEFGIMKPDITFFGEQLPDTFSDRLSKIDKDQVDLVITIGTSLKVAPVSEVIPYLPSNVPQIQINLDPVTHLEFDIDLVGECDIVISELCRNLGWNLEHKMIPKDQKIEITPTPGYSNRHEFKQLHPVKTK